MPVPTPVYPPTPEPKERKLVAPPGCWCIVGVDSFGLGPIYKNSGLGYVTLSLLNDQGEIWKVRGLGAGPGIGLDIGPEMESHILRILKDAILKAGDVPNVLETIKNLGITGPSDTCGPVLKRVTWKADLSIHDITRRGCFVIAMGEGHLVVSGAEVGVIAFQPPGAQLSIALGDPWGFYVSLGLGTLKAALGASVTAFKIISTTKES